MGVGTTEGGRFELIRRTLLKVAPQESICNDQVMVPWRRGPG